MNNVIKSRNPLALFVKKKRKELKLTQQQFADYAGVGLRFLRGLENGEMSIRLDKVNQVLELFDYTMDFKKIGETE